MNNNNNNNHDAEGLLLAGQQQQQGGNVEIHDDNVDDEEEEDDGIERDADGVLDGGVAGSSNSFSADDSSTTAAARRRSADCDLLLFIVCGENMDDIAPKHPILKEGVVVSIGLDKNTKLGAVFRRFAEFCNEHSKHEVEDTDLEFFHCQLLNGSDTAESSALMKNDRIKVRKERSADRQNQAELKRLQRDSDKEFFKQLQQLMPSGGANKYCDVVFDCQGKIPDDNGFPQQVLTSKVRGHSVVLGKRCKWLGELIDTARKERVNRSFVTEDPPADGIININNVSDVVIKAEEDAANSPQSQNRIDFPTGHIVANTSSTMPDEDGQRPRRSGDTEDYDEDDDEMGVLPFPMPQNRPQAIYRGGATEIEDDDNNEDGSEADSMGAVGGHWRDRVVRKSFISQESTQSDELVVTISKHSPQAMKLLLEYCYSNRVIPLGHDAYVQACRTKPVKPDGPVAPYSSSRRWPNNGAPQVTLSVALAGISLAEEAGLRRLSLMCEVAASQLVSNANVVHALSACTQQHSLTGNSLPRLREVAMSIILRFGPRGFYDVAVFRKALEGPTTSIIPTLLTGTAEAMATNDKQKNESNKLSGHKRDFSAIADSFYSSCDREDTCSRENERRMRRLERDGKAPRQPAGVLVKTEDEDMYLDQVHSSSWAAESVRRSLKRMSHHVNIGGTFRVDRTGVYATTSRDSGAGVYPTRRRRSSERK
ncbi:expressed unknown protein [Seminavis robusta]|uniref:Uncharacterized protein n=1 Tax=Seminavis robusta TaxID=568900 RepID=A0A9N8HM50_9STRA|nr:expressed unknown protein [Seminavis robusta]|eukprot:Sro878_g214760.1 n/a (709) ;mRNA; f:26903-29205